MVKFISNKKGLRYLTLVLGLLGNNVMNVRADECMVLKGALDSIIAKYGNNNIGDLTNCCSSNGGMVTCENNHITKLKLEKIQCENKDSLTGFVSTISQGLPQLVEFEFTDSTFCDYSSKFPRIKKFKKISL